MAESRRHRRPRTRNPNVRVRLAVAVAVEVEEALWAAYLPVLCQNRLDEQRVIMQPEGMRAKRLVVGYQDVPLGVYTELYPSYLCS
jgi:hypothetical protein